RRHEDGDAQRSGLTAGCLHRRRERAGCRQRRDAGTPPRPPPARAHRFGTTVTVTWNVAVARLWWASSARHSTVVVPAWKLSPERGRQSTRTTTSTASFATGVV